MMSGSRQGRLLVRWRTHVCVLLSVALSVGSGCFSSEEGETFYGRVVVPRAQEFRWSNGGLPQVLDPALAADVGEEYLSLVRGTEYQAALCLVLELDRRFGRFYWTNVADRELPFVGLIEHTNFVEPERYDGRRFLYVANYLPRGHPLLDLGPDELLDAYSAGLRRVNPAFDRAWVRAAHVFKAPYAQPIVRVGYRERLAPHRTPLPGVWLANMGHVYPHDRGQNYSALLGESVADRVLAELGT